MAQIHNFTNFTGTIDGLMYYTANGKQFVRADTKKRTRKKSLENMLQETEAIRTMNAIHSMAHLLNAMKNEFETLSRPIRDPLENEPTTEEFQDTGSENQPGISTADVTDTENESTGPDFHTVNAKKPALVDAVRNKTEIKFTVRGAKEGLYLIILQINFGTGAFKRKKIALADAHCITKNTYTVETEYETRKGYTDLLFLYGQYFLKTVPIRIKKDRNS